MGPCFFSLRVFCVEHSGRAFGKLLYGVRPVDAPVMCVVAVLFAAAALLAALAPTRRAASIDPMEAMQSGL